MTLEFPLIKACLLLHFLHQPKIHLVTTWWGLSFTLETKWKMKHFKWSRQKQVGLKWKYQLKFSDPQIKVFIFGQAFHLAVYDWHFKVKAYWFNLQGSKQTTMAASKKVSIDAAIESIPLELNYFLIERREHWRLFLMPKVFLVFFWLAPVRFWFTRWLRWWQHSPTVDVIG